MQLQHTVLQVLATKNIIYMILQHIVITIINNLMIDVADGRLQLNDNRLMRVCQGRMSAGTRRRRQLSRASLLNHVQHKESPLRRCSKAQIPLLRFVVNMLYGKAATSSHSAIHDIPLNHVMRHPQVVYFCNGVETGETRI